MKVKSTLLAISGGIDSMCMAEIFVRRYPCEQLAVAHCNFNLRGEESDGDEVLVQEWADSHGIRFHVRSFDTKGFAAANGVSIEMAARELRYRWFAELCQSEGYDEVAVAHNANDNAETLILNLLRGSGMNGLAGMSAVSDIPYAEECGARLVRPIIDMTRKQIEGYALANGVKYRNDSTNFSSEYKRNMLRNEVFPVFEKINPSVIRTLNREMGYFAEAGEIVSDWADEIVKSLCHPEGPCHPEEHILSCHPEEGRRPDVRISYHALKSHKHWRYLLYHILQPYGFNSATIASLEDLLSSDRTISGKRFESKGYAVLTERDSFRIVSREKIAGPAGNDGRIPVPGPTSFIPDHTSVIPDHTSVIPDLIGNPVMAVRAAGTYHFNGRAFKVETFAWTRDMDMKQSEGVLVFDADKLRFPFVLRGWRDGDWLVPLGMRGKKKVSDLFADLKYDSFMKASAVMISDVQTEGFAEIQHVAGVAGVRIDDRYKISSTTSSVIRITVE